MVVFRAGPQQNDCEDIASAEGASEKKECFSVCTVEKPLIYPRFGFVSDHHSQFKSIPKLNMRQTDWLANDRFSHASLAKRQ